MECKKYLQYWRFMKITVNRGVNVMGDLVFTITVSEPHHTCFGDYEKQIMELLDICKNDIHRIAPNTNKTKEDVISLIHVAKEKTFIRILNNLKFAIENDFRTKFKPICQEIYNWIQDNQTTQVKSWMSDFDPQRTKYYFDNDHAHGNSSRQESEHIIDVDLDEEGE